MPKRIAREQQAGGRFAQEGPGVLGIDPGSSSRARRSLRKLFGQIVGLANHYLINNLISWDTQRRAIYGLFVLSQETSRATLELADRALVVPALMLQRARTEQLIVSSYLVHEAPERGITPFVTHMPVNSFLGLRTAFSDPLVRKFLAPNVDYEGAKEGAIEAMANLKPDFDAEQGEFQRKWTKLDLLSMAKRRDALAAPKLSLISALPIQSFYPTAYSTLSAVIHADCLAISPSFLGALKFETKRVPVLSKGYHWIDSIFSLVVLCDMIQLYEAMGFFAIDASAEVAPLIAEWREASRNIPTK